MKILSKILVCAILMMIVLSRVDLSVVFNLFASVTWIPILVAFFVGIGERCLVAFRLQILIGTFQKYISYRNLLGVLFISGFLGSFLPSGIGTDAVLVWLLTRYGIDMSNTVAAAFADRLAGLFVLLLLTFSSMLYLSINFTGIPIIVMGAAIVGIIILIVVVSIIRSEWMKEWLRWLVDRYKEKWKFIKKLEIMLQLPRTLEKKKHLLGMVLLLSLTVQGTRILSYYLLGLAIGTETSITWFFLLMPPIILVTFIPISIGGLGTREAAFVYFFSLAGMQTSEAFTISILSHMMIAVSGAITGGFFYMTGNVSLRKAKRELKLAE